VFGGRGSMLPPWAYRSECPFVLRRLRRFALAEGSTVRRISSAEIDFSFRRSRIAPQKAGSDWMTKSSQSQPSTPIKTDAGLPFRVITTLSAHPKPFSIRGHRSYLRPAIAKRTQSVGSSWRSVVYDFTFHLSLAVARLEGRGSREGEHVFSACSGPPIRRMSKSVCASPRYTP